jgi:hypothetical protein
MKNQIQYINTGSVKNVHKKMIFFKTYQDLQNLKIAYACCFQNISYK